MVLRHTWKAMFAVCLGLLLLTAVACTSHPVDVSPVTHISPTTERVLSTLTFTPAPLPPTNTPTPAQDHEARHISTDYLREVFWSAQEGAFVLATWGDENAWWALSPESPALASHPSPVAALDLSLRQEFGLYEDAAYALSNDGQAVLYHREGESSVELWYADLSSHETTRVLQDASVYEGGCCVETIAWLEQSQEALLMQTSGEALVIRRLDVATRLATSWADGVTGSDEVPVEDVVPHYVALAGDGRQLAIAGSVLGPQPDRLWILDLATRELVQVGEAYAGMRPLWSDDVRYVYYARGETSHYFGAYDHENPLGIYKFDRETGQTMTLLAPGVLGSVEIGPQWSISGNENYVVYSVISNWDDASQEGIGLVDLH